MSRQVTSFGRIKGLDAFTQSIGKLGDRLGSVRIKVPQARDDGFLLLLLDSLDPGVRWALDFRHESWSAPEVDERLDDRGLARVGSLVGAADFRYLRERDPPYDQATLVGLADDVRPALKEGADVYCFFRHEDEPTAPAYAERLLELAGRSESL